MHKKSPVLFIAILLFVSFLSGCGGRSVTQEEFIPPVFPPPPEKPRFIYERTLRSSFDVKEITAVDRLKMFATGSIGSGFGLAKPYGVAVHKGKVYVSDTVGRVVYLFDFPAREFKPIGSGGPGQLVKPIGLSIDHNTGTLYVADNTAKRVVAFDDKGKYIHAFGGPQLLKRPTGVTVSPDGRLLYVIDTGGVDTSAHHMHIFDSQTTELLHTVGTRGKEEGEFNLPLQAATARDGTVYVVDGGNFRVQAFDRNGNFLQTFGAIGQRSGQFSRPKGIATDKSGNIYVADAAFGNFQIFAPSGQLLLFVGDRGTQGAPAEYMLPAGIAVDEDGRVYMVDQYFKKVDVYRPANLKREEGYLSSLKKKKRRDR